MKRKLIIIFSIILLSFFYSCDEGLAPTGKSNLLKSPPGFGGTIRFEGEWSDSVVRTLIVAFKEPLLSPSDFTILNLGFISDTIPKGIRNFQYSSSVSPLIPVQAGTYKYVAVIQTKDPNLSFDRSAWYVVGVYTEVDDQNIPGTLILTADKFIEPIDIKCDFNNPPPQPPGGN